MIQLLGIVTVSYTHLDVYKRQPPQMHTARRYSLQYLLSADSNFLFYALHEWLESGRLQPPAEKQRRSLTTLLIAPH